MSKPLPEDVMVCAFRDKAAVIANGGNAEAALEFVKDLVALDGKVELRLAGSLLDDAPKTEKKHDGRPIVLDSKYPGRCKKCAKVYNAGDSVRWIKGLGCFCLSCSPNA